MQQGRDQVLRAVTAIRLAVLVAASGAVLGAMMMFWLGGMKLVAAAGDVFGRDAKTGIAGILEATDVFLLGIVLLVLASGIALVFVADLAEPEAQAMPRWMRMHSIADLKHRLFDMIVVYLIVDLATDWAQAGLARDWDLLVKPVALILVAVAALILRLARGHADRAAAKPVDNQGGAHQA